MKYRVLILMIFFVWLQHSIAQEKIKVLQLDFKNKEFIGISDLESLRQGDFYQVEVNNVNLNMYKIIFDKRDTVIVSDVPFPTFDLINLGGVSDLLSKINVSSFTKGKSDTLKAEFLKYSYVDPEIFFLQSTSEVQKIRNRIAAEKAILLSKDSVIKEEINKIDSLLLSIEEKILSYSVLDKENANYQLLSGSTTFKGLLLTTKASRENLLKLQKALIEQQAKYIQYISDDKIKKVMDDQLKEEDKVLKEAFTKTIASVEKLYESINSVKVSAWIKEIIYKENNSVSSYKTLPQQLNGDRTTLNIQLIPAKEDYNLPSYRTEIQFPQQKPFYIGLGMSFYHARFKSDVYSIRETAVNDSISNYQIVDEKNKEGELGITALIHFGYRPFYFNKNLDWFAVNLVMGPALSLTNMVKPRLAVGGGVAFGRKNMLSLNLLYIGGYVDRKSELYDTETTYDIKPGTVTVSRLQGTFAFSLGYIYKF